METIKQNTCVANFYSYGDTIVINKNNDILTAVINNGPSIIITKAVLIDELTDLCNDLKTLEDEQNATDERSSNWWGIEEELADIQTAIIDILNNCRG